jgi:hypothetical protein
LRLAGCSTEGSVISYDAATGTGAVADSIIALRQSILLSACFSKGIMSLTSCCNSLLDPVLPPGPRAHGGRVAQESLACPQLGPVILGDCRESCELCFQWLAGFGRRAGGYW